MSKLFKTLVPSKVAGDGDGGFTFTITSGAVDRDNDTIDPKGWDFENFLKNPVLLWAHDNNTPPIGRVTSLKATASAIKAKVEFPDPGIHPLADTVRGLLEGGFLRAVSVGFMPKRAVENIDRGGVDFVEQELLELSIVPVPSNPEALLEARAAGLDVGQLKGWAEKTIGLFTETKAAEPPTPPLVTVEPQAPVIVKDLIEVEPVDGFRAYRLAPEEKAGRVLSKKNESRIRAAHTALNEILSEMAAPEDEEDEDAKSVQHGELSATSASSPAPAQAVTKTAPGASRPPVNTEAVIRAVHSALDEVARQAVLRASGRLD